jgi:hypothetical protein
LAPALVLALLLGGLVVHDVLIRGDKPVVTGKRKPKPPPEIDKQPRLALVYDPEASTFRFGLTTKDPKSKEKRLTFSKPRDGKPQHFSSLAVQIDRQAFTPELSHHSRLRLPDHLVEKPVMLNPDANGEHGGWRCSWLWTKSRIRVTQTVEIIAGQPDRATGKRLLDTCLVRFTLKNEDSQAHTVGLRFLLDTFIGENDGVPFYVPRNDNPLVESKDNFKDAQVPDYIQALEVPKLDAEQNTIAQVGLKIGGGIGPPSRVALTHWYPLMWKNFGGDCGVEYEVPMLSIRGKDNPHFEDKDMDADMHNDDSAVVMYWDDKELAKGEERTLGFTYGLGKIATSGGTLGITPPPTPRTGEAFPVTALITKPLDGQTVEIDLPEGLELVTGAPKQAVPPAQGGANSSVTWGVKAAAAGTYEILVYSSSAPDKPESIQVTVIPKQETFLK